MKSSHTVSKNFLWQSGVSLLEVLVALFVLAVGLLGVIALQAETIKLNQQAYGSTQAILAANDAAERMRVNLPAYVSTLSKAQQEQPLDLDRADLLNDAAYVEWQTMVTNAVPGGKGEIVEVDGTEFKITITYSVDVLDNENKSTDSETIDYVLFTRM